MIAAVAVAAAAVVVVGYDLLQVNIRPRLLRLYRGSSFHLPHLRCG